MEIKTFAAEFKASTEGHINGYASVFGNQDSHGDVVQPGAFTRTLQNDRGRIKVLWQHDTYEPIGLPTTMHEDEHGLRVEAQIVPTSRGKDALELIRGGVVNELSIGYDAIRDEYDSEKHQRRLLELRLWEFSPVTWASNDLARITSVKNASDLDLILDRLDRLAWTKGRLESPRLRERVDAAIRTLTSIKDGESPSTVGDPAPATPPALEAAPSIAYATLEHLTALRHKLRAASVLNDLRAFGETLKETAR